MHFYSCVCSVHVYNNANDFIQLGINLPQNSKTTNQIHEEAREKACTSSQFCYRHVRLITLLPVPPESKRRACLREEACASVDGRAPL